ncbi:MAG: hypothetical protein PUK61_08940 [[Actinobacillus] rossii]|nr:hypothetical protein [[Actinobacillus] rossii]
MKRQKQVCKPLSKVNHLAYKYLEQVNKAIIAINYIGLEVKEIQFNHIKPRILVRDIAY